MKAIAAATIVVAAALLAPAVSTRLSPTPAAAPTSGPTGVSPATGRAPAQTLTSSRPSLEGSYRFTRRIEAHLGPSALISLDLSGTARVRELDETGASRPGTRAWQVEIRLDRHPALGELGQARLRLSAGNRALAAEVVPGSRAAASSPEASGMLARFAADVADQVLFFASSDLQGDYEAEFSHPDAHRWLKSKTVYRSGPYRAAIGLRSRHELRADDRGRAERIEGSESLTLEQGGHAILATTRYEIARLSAEAPGAPMAGAWQPVPLAALAPGFAPSTARGGTDSLEDVPAWDELLHTLRQGGLRTAEARLGLFRRLAKRLRADGALAESARQALDELRSRPEDQSLLIGALAATSRPETHLVLRDAYRDPASDAAGRQVILNAWITTASALPQAATRFIRELAESPSSSPTAARGAWLALGAQAAKTEDPAERAELEEALLARLRAARSADERIQALESLGNAGTPRVFAEIHPYLADPDERVRARAYLSIRRVPGARALEELRRGLDDPSPQVRRSVQTALKLRDSETGAP